VQKWFPNASLKYGRATLELSVGAMSSEGQQPAPGDIMIVLYAKSARSAVKRSRFYGWAGNSGLGGQGSGNPFQACCTPAIT